MARFARLLLVVLAVLVCVYSALVGTGCARIVPPAGGAKDTLAPLVVYTSPKNGELNFKKKTIKIEFNEDIIANSLNQELILSPVQDNIFTYKIKRNKLVLDFEKPFPDSSTILLNFRNGIADLNEKIPAKNLKIAFSTGRNLDTISVQGTINEWLTKAPQKGVTVGLWAVSDTLDIKKHKPLYLTKSLENGFYLLDYIKKGTYRLAAFDDRNGNAKWNGKAESIAFMPSLLLAYKDTNINLILTQIDEEPPRLERAQTLENAQAEFKFNEGLEDLQVFVGADSLPRMPSAIGGASFTSFFAKEWQDSLLVRLLATDSAGNKLDTTALLPPLKKVKSKDKGKAKDSVKTKVVRFTELNTGSSGYFLPADFTLLLQEPLPHSISNLEFSYRTDTLHAKQPLVFKLNKYRNMANALLPQTLTLALQILTKEIDATATGARVKADTLTINTLSEDRVGLIRGILAPQKEATILELLNSKGVVQKQLFNAKAFVFMGLLPDTYTLRLTLDANKNKKRDLPSYTNWQLGEVVLPPSAPVQVKANWEVEVGTVFE